MTFSLTPTALYRWRKTGPFIGIEFKAEDFRRCIDQAKDGTPTNVFIAGLDNHLVISQDGVAVPVREPEAGIVVEHVYTIPLDKFQTALDQVEASA